MMRELALADMADERDRLRCELAAAAALAERNAATIAELTALVAGWRGWGAIAIRQLRDATDPGPGLVAEITTSEWDTILATPATDPKTPRSEAAESPPVAFGEKPNTGHPAGGRAVMVRNCTVETLWVPPDDGSDAHEPVVDDDPELRGDTTGLYAEYARPPLVYERLFVAVHTTDAHEPVPHTPVDVVVDLLSKRMVAAPDRQRLGKALDEANVSTPGEGGIPARALNGGDGRPTW
jgi:hypothetical protein